MITVEEINEAWGWVGLNAVEVLGENAFGNLIIRHDDGMYWRLSPDDLCCEPVAENRAALDALSYNQAFFVCVVHARAGAPGRIHARTARARGEALPARFPSALGGD